MTVATVTPIRSVRARPRPKPVRVELTGQEKARLRRVCDYLIDAEDELLHVVKADPSLKPHLDTIVESLVHLTRRAHE